MVIRILALICSFSILPTCAQALANDVRDIVLVKASTEQAHITPPFVVTIGASWCAGCKNNMDILEQWAQLYPIVYIHCDKPFPVQRTSGEWLDLFDPSMDFVRQNQIEALPFTILVHSDYSIELAIVGPIQYPEDIYRIAPLLEKE